jgi:GT2 family glycosyltransferase
MTGTPRISVVMPVRNSARWLAAAIDSVLGQSFADFELIVVDDGSTDESPAIAAGYAGRDARVRVIRQEHRGVPAALNRALAVARAPLIARLDSDDEALPQRLARQLGYLEAHPDVVLLGSWADVIDEAGNVVGQLQPDTRPDRLMSVLARTNPFVNSSVMFRADAARTAGNYRAAFALSEDYDLWLRLSEIGGVAIEPTRLVRYRRHASGVTQAAAARQIFSARLAVRAAAQRRRSGDDPAAALTAAPDFLSPAADATFYAADARICRFVAMADAAHARTAAAQAIDWVQFDRDMASMSHRERKLAQQAILNLLPRATDAAQRLKLLRRLLWLHPPRAIALLIGAGRNAMPPVGGR